MCLGDKGDKNVLAHALLGLGFGGIKRRGIKKEEGKKNAIVSVYDKLFAAPSARLRLRRRQMESTFWILGGSWRRWDVSNLGHSGQWMLGKQHAPQCSHHQNFPAECLQHTGKIVGSISVPAWFFCCWVTSIFFWGSKHGCKINLHQLCVGLWRGLQLPKIVKKNLHLGEGSGNAAWETIAACETLGLFQAKIRKFRNAGFVLSPGAFQTPA